jgi:hypothetical protein
MPETAKDRTSLVIAILLHVVLIGGVVYWSTRATGKWNGCARQCQYVKGEEEKEEEARPVRQSKRSAEAPPINQGMKAPRVPARRAVAGCALGGGRGDFSRHAQAGALLPIALGLRAKPMRDCSTDGVNPAQNQFLSGASSANNCWRAVKAAALN